MTRFNAAVVQAAPVAFDAEATLAKVEALTAESAAGGAKLVVFPEAFVSAYPRGMTFGTTIGSRTPEGRAWYRRYHESSIDVPGPAVDRLGRTAREHGVHLVIGVIERDGATLYCTALFLAPSGELLGKHRKLMPTAAERLAQVTEAKYDFDVVGHYSRPDVFCLSVNEQATPGVVRQDEPTHVVPDVAKS